MEEFGSRTRVRALGVLVLATVCAPAAVATPARLDVEHYELTLEVDLAAGSVRGDESIRFVASPGTPVSFDLTGLEIDAVSERGGPLQFERVGDALRLPASRSGRTRTVRVRYHGQPSRGFKLAPAPATAAYTVFNTWGWMVARTDPADRATLALRVIAAAPLDVVGTGQARGTRRLSDGRVEHAFALADPHPAYLFGFAIGALATREHQAGPVRLVLRAPADQIAALEPALAETARMLRFFEQRAGQRFPGSTYTLVFLPEAPAQEMAGMTLLSTDYALELAADPHEDWLLAHELAHQWWGNRLTCAEWGHFWLNEGVATFLAAAWKEQRWGRPAYERELALARERLAKAAASGRNRPLVLADWRTPEGSGGTIPYQRGALFLDHLRQELGEARFWAAVRAYTQHGREGAAWTADLQRAFEQAAGRSLSGMFEDWTTGLTPERPPVAGATGD